MNTTSKKVGSADSHKDFSNFSDMFYTFICEKYEFTPLYSYYAYRDEVWDEYDCLTCLFTNKQKQIFVIFCDISIQDNKIKMHELHFCKMCKYLTNMINQCDKISQKELFRNLMMYYESISKPKYIIKLVMLTEHGNFIFYLYMINYY